MPRLPELDQYLVPLLQGDDSRPQILGTATFCHAGGEHFLVTAAHVVDDRDTLSFGRGIFQEGAAANVVTTALPASGNRDDDLLDLAVFKLTAEQAQALHEQGRRAIAVADWGVDDIPRPGQVYVFGGFPASDTHLDRAERMLEPRRVSAQCRAVLDERVVQLGLHPRQHAVGHYQRRRMSNGNGRVVMGPEPFGMSGGPVWTLRENSDQYIWVGVGIEYRRTDCVLVGTRVGAVSALMQALSPGETAHLPQPATYQFVVGSYQP